MASTSESKVPFPAVNITLDVNGVYTRVHPRHSIIRAIKRVFVNYISLHGTAPELNVHPSVSKDLAIY